MLPPSVTTVLFDISGVFTPDQWETILADKKHGVARHLNITFDQLALKVRPIYTKFALAPAGTEQKFWEDIGHALGMHIQYSDVVDIRKKLVTLNQSGNDALKYLQTKAVRIGLISSCTSFFYEYQNQLAHFERYADPNLIFLSYQHGVDKHNGLFEMAAKRVIPSTTLVIDDRPKNVAAAEQAGFRAARYSMLTDGSLLEFVKQFIV